MPNKQDNVLKDTLLEIKAHVDNFKGKRLMEDMVKDKLEKSFESYNRSLNRVYNYLLNEKPLKSLKKIKNIM